MISNSKNINYCFRESFLKNTSLKLFSDYKASSYTYDKVAKLIHQFHNFFELCRIERGDKIALLGANSAHWGISFLATITYGATVVPILPDFRSEDIEHIIDHSEAKILLCSNQILLKIDTKQMQNLCAIVNIDTFDTVWSITNEALLYWKNFSPNQSTFSYENFMKTEINPNDICIMSYTSGTSGFSKGVMIPAKALASNLTFALDNMYLEPGSSILSFLPMAHIFGLLFDFLFPFVSGCHITFLSKLPTPKIIIEAFSEIKPRLILSVPLVIEKIYFKQIKPTIDKPLIKFLLKSPFKKLIHKKLHNRIYQVFGGNFKELVVGGAAINDEVEKFFRTINFPFIVGYGMTECSPLISYSGWEDSKFKSAGKLVDRMEIKIDSDNWEHKAGEILVRGENVMLGYYKNSEATSETIDEDGWLHTGDLGVMDKDGFIFIKGRSKNMILDASGQNIYPEEIEAKLSSIPIVSECIIIEENKKIVALVYPDLEFIKNNEYSDDELPELMEKCRTEVNAKLAKYNHISQIRVMDKEFEKTPKKSIKRYLYTK